MENREDEYINLCLQLFVSRRDTYAVQRVQGEDQSYIRVDEELTDKVLKEHIEGKETVGIYQFGAGKGRVKWGCLDIDGEHVVNAGSKGYTLWQRLVSAGFPSESILIEESGSPDSYHIWVFFENPTSAKSVKAFLEMIIKPIDSNIEVFPKQKDVGVDGYGNLVKLPLGFHKAAKKRSTCVMQSKDGTKAKDIDALKSIMPCKLPKLPTLKTTGLRPCFVKAIEERLILEGSDGNNFRLALVCEMIAKGYTDEAMHEVFEIQSDYSREVTQQKIRESRDSKYQPWQCDTIKDKCFSLVGSLCDTCVKTAPEKTEAEGRPEEDPYKHKAYFEHEGHLYLEILTTEGNYKFAYRKQDGKIGLIDEFEDIKPVEIPRKGNGDISEVMKLPDESIVGAPLLSPKDLLAKVEEHIKAYCDLDTLDLKLCSYYPLFTWFYQKLNTVPFLRFLADTGKGKTRMVEVVGDLCFYPLKAGGATSFSSMMRKHEEWKGTIIGDEIDIKGGKEDQRIKYHNSGMDRSNVFMLSDQNDAATQYVFEPFGARVFGMRAPFQDNATEGRLLSISPHERTNKVPILLMRKYGEDAKELRNEIARFVLEHWEEVDGEELMDFDDMGIEPRLQQLAMPLSVIFQLWEDGKELFRDYMLRRQQDLKRERANSWEGIVFNYALALAIGNEVADEKFWGYYIPEDEIERERAETFYADDAPIIQAITPAMLAKALNITAKTASKALRSIGFEVQNKKIRYYEGGKYKSKSVNAFYIEDEKRWHEMTQRYYFNEPVTEVTEVTHVGTEVCSYFFKNNSNTPIVGSVTPLVFSMHTPVSVSVTCMTSMTGIQAKPSPALDTDNPEKQQTSITQVPPQSLLHTGAREEPKPKSRDTIKSISPLVEAVCGRCNEHTFLSHKWKEGEEEHLICDMCTKELKEAIK